MDLLFDLSWLSMIIVGLGTLFLIGEILVNARGFFALIGITFITIYFYTFVPDVSMIIIMFVIYMIGLLLIIIDGKILNDGTLSTLGVVSMIISVSIAAPNLASGVYAVIGLVIGGLASLLFMKIFKKRPMWSKLALKDRLTTEDGYTTLTEEYKNLKNENGITLTDLRPSGTIVIKKKEYSAITTGGWIGKGIEIKVINVDGTKIQVEKANFRL